jgi:hypothetical protein
MFFFCRLSFAHVMTIPIVLLIIGILVLHHKHTLVLIGDAIADALENGTSLGRPDSDYPTLAPPGSCVVPVISKWSSLSRPRWHQAITRKFWVTSMILYDLRQSLHLTIHELIELYKTWLRNRSRLQSFRCRYRILSRRPNTCESTCLAQGWHW